MTTTLQKLRRHGVLFLLGGVLLVFAMISWERRQTEAVGDESLSVEVEE